MRPVVSNYTRNSRLWKKRFNPWPLTTRTMSRPGQGLTDFDINVGRRLEPRQSRYGPDSSRPEPLANRPLPVVGEQESEILKLVREVPSDFAQNPKPGSTAE